MSTAGAKQGVAAGAQRRKITFAVVQIVALSLSSAPASASGGSMFAVRSRATASVVALIFALTACGETTGGSGLVVGTPDTGVDEQTVADSTDLLPDTATDDVAGDLVSLPDAASDAPGDVPPDDAQTDADVQLPDADAASTDVEDTAPDGDLAEVDAAVDVALDVAPDVPLCTAAGCSCKTGADCDSSVCLDDVTGKVCAATCTDTCPAGYGCVASGTLKVCKPAFARLCEPCNQDADCVDAADGTGACVAYKNGASLIGNFCGGGKCDAKTLCPAGFTCATVVSVDGFAMAQCIRDDKQCPCDTRAQTLSLGTTCSTANSDGTCGGKRNCSASGLSACSALTPSAEICDGLDNDCNSKTDDVSCDDGNPCTSDFCDGAAQACKHTPASAPCDDGSKCTTSDACANGACTGKLKNCDDGNECTDDSCEPKSGCVSTAATGPCGAGGNGGATDICTVPGQCSDNSCVGAKAKNCDDGNPCTVDACDPTSGCVHKPTTAACNDSDPCTTSDNCSTGICQGTQKNCDDNNVCTDDSCDATGCHNTATGGPCDDGNACTSSDTCANGTCAGKGKNCNDGNSCTNDSCDLNKGCSNVLVVGAGCDDGNPCSNGEKCDSSGVCQAGVAVVCDDGNPCTSDSCDGATGVCKYTNLTGACDDGIACTISDVCAGGTCSGTTKKCNDGNVCTTDQCDNVKGCLYTAIVNASCDDGNLCTNGDKCDGNGACQAGLSTNCDDLNGCTADACDMATGACKNTNISSACDDGNACTNKDFCAVGACAGTAISCDDNNACTSDNCDKVKGCLHVNLTSACSDGNPCTTGEKCDGAGTCQVGTPVNCDDLNSCTVDVCDQTAGACKNTNLTSACDDGSACTKSDVCAGGSCVGTAISCDDGSVCTADSCDKVKGCQHVNLTGSCSDNNPCTSNDTCSAGNCAGGSTTSCDDSNPCTSDFCDTTFGCGHTNNNISCSDGNSCTTGDACSGGTCVSGTNQCACQADGDCPATTTPCAGQFMCDKSALPYKCVTNVATKVVCDTSKNTACSTTACDNATGTCKTSNINESGGCSDGSACTVGDKCTSGLCISGATADCNDLNGCTNDSCDPASGCKHANNTASCDDGSACTIGDICGGGACVPGTTIICDDAKPCTADSCDSTTGCKHVNTTGTCSDGSACTSGDLCSGGACVPGSVIDCNDGNLCTTDACDTLTGCKHVNNSVSCDDGDACTSNDTCGAAKCTGATVVGCCTSNGQCDDGNACTVDSCDPGTSKCVHNTAAADNQLCNADGSGCTQNDSCQSGSCVAGSAPDCSGVANACNTGVCNSTGANSHTCVATSKVDGTSCDADGNGCTQNDKCLSGVCSAGAAVDCQQGLDQCSAGACKSLTASSYTCTTSFKAGGTACDDTKYCTIGETCNGSGVCGGGSARDCSGASTQCTTGTCSDALAKCISTTPVTNGTVCSDGDICTSGDNCVSGICTAASTVCGEHKVSTFKTALAGLRAPLVDTTLGRFGLFWRNGNDTIARWMSKDWSREAQEFNLTNTASTTTTLAASSFPDGRAVVVYADRSFNSTSYQCTYPSGYGPCGSGDGTCYIGSYSYVYPHYSGTQSQNVNLLFYDKNGVTTGVTGKAFTQSASWTYVCYSPTQFTAIDSTRVAALANGNAIVAYHQGTTWTATLMNSTGAVVKQTVASNSNGDNGWDVAGYSDGSFAIIRATTTKLIKLQQYNTDGSVKGSEIDVAPVYDATVLSVSNPAIAIRSNSDDRASVAWEVNKSGDTDIAGRVYQSDLTPVNNAFVANTTTTGMQVTPRVGIYPTTGHFMIVWEDQSGLDGSTNGIVGQLYSKTGVTVGAEKVLNLVKTGAQKSPDITGISTNHVVVDWLGTDGHIYSRKFDTTGNAIDDVKENQVNTTFQNDQKVPAVASTSVGTSVATWQSDGQDGSGLGVIAQRYDATGTKVGNELVVNQTITDAQQAPQIAVDASGNFVVVWQSYIAADASGITAEDIYFRLYAADGSPLTTELAANTKTSDSQLAPDVARLPTGQFGIVWTTYNDPAGNSQDAMIRCFDSAGNAISNKAEVFANTNKTEKQKNVRIAASGVTGFYLVVWDSFAEDGTTPSSWAIRGQLFNANNCGPVGAQISINSTATGDQQYADVAANSKGDFLAVWSSTQASANGYDIWARLIKYDSASGNYTPQTEFKVNPIVSLEQSYPVLANLTDDGFEVVWRTYGEDEDSAGLKGQKLDAALALVGNDWLINLSTTGNQVDPAIAALPGGGYTILWDSPGQDGSGVGVIGRRFPAP
jgi:hypothetical protein